VYVKVVGQAGAATSAKVHSNIKSVRFDGGREGFLRFPYQFDQLQQFFIGRLFEAGDMPGGGYQ
jgi:hypothetical protein